MRGVTVHAGRYTTSIEGPFVVFLIYANMPRAGHGTPQRRAFAHGGGQTPKGSAVDSLMTVTATEEFTDCTQGMRDR